MAAVEPRIVSQTPAMLSWKEGAMTTRSLMFVLIVLIALSGTVAQAHVPSVFNEEDRRLDSNARSLQDDPFKMHRCHLLLDNGSSETLMRSQETRNAEICLLPTPPQQRTLKTASEA